MHAYLFVGNNKENINEKIKEFFGDISENISNQPISKIEDVRNLRKSLKLSQKSLTHIKIENIDLATIEAQNAFLKNLEEPPNNVCFILTANSETYILPTILSRCQLVKSTNLFQYSKSDMSDYFEKDITERITYLGKVQKKDDAIKFITNLIYYIHDLLKTEAESKTILLNTLKYANKTLLNIKSNGNVFLQLFNFAIKTR